MNLFNRFVILFHDNPMPHYDFMMEKPHKLETWRFNMLPGKAPFLAEKSNDHRLEYLDYEGPISRNRGTVKKIDNGTYKLIADSEFFIIIEIVGEKYQGTINLDKLGQNSFLGSFLDDNNVNQEGIS